MASPTATPSTTSSTIRDVVRVLTPPGAAGIAVVELRGAIGRFVQRHLRPDGPLDVLHPSHRKLTADVEIIDDPLVLLRAANVLELHLHGGPWIVRRTVELAQNLGFLLENAEPTTVEDWLPWMRTELGVRLLLERGVPLDTTLRRMAFPARVALVGPPNVGKSTLANRLLGRDRFITADLPGTTRDWVEELAGVGGVPMILTDTPGQRATDDGIEADAIARSRIAIDAADAIVAVHDPTTIRPWPKCDLRVMNKADCPHGRTDAVEVSARTGVGVDALIAALHAVLGVKF